MQRPKLEKKLVPIRRCVNYLVAHGPRMLPRACLSGQLIQHDDLLTRAGARATWPNTRCLRRHPCTFVTVIATPTSETPYQLTTRCKRKDIRCLPPTSGPIAQSHALPPPPLPQVLPPHPYQSTSHRAPPIQFRILCQLACRGPRTILTRLTLPPFPRAQSWLMSASLRPHGALSRSAIVTLITH